MFQKYAKVLVVKATSLASVQSLMVHSYSTRILP